MFSVLLSNFGDDILFHNTMYLMIVRIMTLIAIEVDTTPTTANPLTSCSEYSFITFILHRM